MSRGMPRPRGRAHSFSLPLPWRSSLHPSSPRRPSRSGPCRRKAASSRTLSSPRTVPRISWTLSWAGWNPGIVFTIRLYQKRTGILSFIRGDMLVVQATVVRSAYRDILTQMFVIMEEGRSPVSYGTTDQLLAAFFTVRGHLSSPARGQAGRIVRRRARTGGACEADAAPHPGDPRGRGGLRH